MVNIPSVPEIITVNSEVLQSQVRDLLPSQSGFGSELQASNVITPIIDLTRAAEGSTVPEILQTALAFGSQTAFIAQNSTVTIANSAGFYRVVAGCTNGTDSSGQNEVQITMDDGASTKIVYQFSMGGTSKEYSAGSTIDLVFWLAPGITLKAVTNDGTAVIAGSIRQIADSKGVLINPVGFAP